MNYSTFHELAEKYETPLYIYDGEKIVQRPKPIKQAA